MTLSLEKAAISSTTMRSHLISNGDIYKKVSLLDIICSGNDDIRNMSLAEYCSPEKGACSNSELLMECEQLDKFRRTSKNLYETVRALFFLYAIYRFHINSDNDNDNDSENTERKDFEGEDEEVIPYIGYKALLDRDFDQAIDHFRKFLFSQQHSRKDKYAIYSSLSKAYYQLAFQTLANQVKRSVQNHPGNCWMFQTDQITTTIPDYKIADDENNSHYQHPLRLHSQLLPQNKSGEKELTMILMESTPVRMDLSHCGWSDIFFLGMDYPEGARVLNISIDLAVHGRDDVATSPIHTYLRVLDDQPGVLKLTSVDLKATTKLHRVAEVFQFGQDYLGLLRAGIIASGLIPPALEHDKTNMPLSQILDTIIGTPKKGLEIVTQVNDIPKGSRLAVSTNLLGSIIALCMRATGQTSSLTGALTEKERRLVAARAILGEWLGGSGGGWQDSGGIWPGIKLIEGVKPQREDPEFGQSRGRLLPLHTQVKAPPLLIESLQKSLVLVHGGMAQNVGPVLEMVTEKYLLRESDEWVARQEALKILDDILVAFDNCDLKSLAQLTTRNFFGPLQTIIPWASNLYTETLIERTKNHFGDTFLGFWMLGGCSGGGMGFIFEPSVKAEALTVMQDIMLKTKREMENALPFAMDPVVYDFSVNNHGTVAELLPITIQNGGGNQNEFLPWMKKTKSCNKKTTLSTNNSQIINESASIQMQQEKQSLDTLLYELGFDNKHHELIRSNLKKGVIGLSQNRLPLDTKLENVRPDDVIMTEESITPELVALGEAELNKGTVAVVTLAAGVGSRWTQGAGVVKAINPFCKLSGRHRSFVEVHIAKSRRISKDKQYKIPHVFTTSHMTNQPIQEYLSRLNGHDYDGPIYISQGRTIGLRLVPTKHDLKFAWEETQQQKLDEQAQKVRISLNSTLMGWAEKCGEASDYRDNLPLQCLHPVGHYFEIPNLLLNGTLQRMLSDRPQLKYLMLHNIDTAGADVDPGLLGLFMQNASTLCFEVMNRGIEDTGGGLARVNNKVRLVEGLALPREDDEFKFSYYNSMTTWIDIDKLLQKFGLTRNNISDKSKVEMALYNFSNRLPTYITIKEVKKRWGHGQEDIHPVAQFEKLWGDMSSFEDVDCQFFVVPRCRGQQLKDPAQMDSWLRDGSASYVENICSWN